MRCMLCHRFSRDVICGGCASRLLSPNVRRRTVGTLEVISLFDYSTIEPLLLTKHTPLGHRVYRFFGKRIIGPFVSEYLQQTGDPVTIVGVDEHVRYGYAHVALLTRAIDHPRAKVVHGALLSEHAVHYAGKTLQYRLEHPRNFNCTEPVEANCILVDDIITTGTTLQEAKHALIQQSNRVLFAVTLADARF